MLSELCCDGGWSDWTGTSSSRTSRSVSWSQPICLDVGWTLSVLTLCSTMTCRKTRTHTCTGSVYASFVSSLVYLVKMWTKLSVNWSVHKHVWADIFVLSKSDIAVCNQNHTIMGNHFAYGIAKCYPGAAHAYFGGGARFDLAPFLDC